MLIVTVLAVMITMVVILSVTAQFALSAQRSASAQQSSVQATYSAEAALSRAQSRLNVVNALLGGKVSIDKTTYNSQILTDILSLCGLSALPSSATNQMVCGSKTATGGGIFANRTVNDLASGNLLDFFVKYVPAASFNAVNYSLGSGSAKDFWAQMFSQAGSSFGGGNNGTEYNTNLRIVIYGVNRLGPDTYQIILGVPTVSATGRPDESSRRNLSVNSLNKTYLLTISRGSLARYALLTNRHYASSSDEAGCVTNPSNCNRITFTSNTVFSGPVHTNSNFNFQGRPYFGGTGAVSSAGCPAGGIKQDSNGNDYCSTNSNPGAYFFSTTWKAKSTMSPNDQAPTVTVSTQTGNQTSDPKFLNGVNWNSDFVALPKNSVSQANQSKLGGVYIGGNASNLTLKTSTETLGGSSKPAQLISYTLSNSTTPVNLAVDADDNVYLKSAGGTWQVATQDPVTGSWTIGGTGTKFNGVIYASGNVNNLNGPARTNASDPATAAPAVASFSQMTLAASGNIVVTSDLKYADPPCSGKNSVVNDTFTAAPCNNKNASNILGIFSSGGDVRLLSPNCAASNTDGTCATAGSRPGMPKDVNIHAVLMASQGKVMVDGYNSGAADGSLGQVNLIGGIIENYYGAFGLTDGRGYGRNFVYDPRTGEGLTPPFFPTEQSWVANLNAPIKLQLNGNQIQKSNDE